MKELLTRHRPLCLLMACASPARGCLVGAVGCNRYHHYVRDQFGRAELYRPAGGHQRACGRQRLSWRQRRRDDVCGGRLGCVGWYRPSGHSGRAPVCRGSRVVRRLRWQRRDTGPCPERKLELSRRRRVRRSQGSLAGPRCRLHRERRRLARFATDRRRRWRRGQQRRQRRQRRRWCRVLHGERLGSGGHERVVWGGWHGWPWGQRRGGRRRGL